MLLFGVWLLHWELLLFQVALLLLYHQPFSLLFHLQSNSEACLDPIALDMRSACKD